MRARSVALTAAIAALVLAGCAGGPDEAPEAAPAAVTTPAEATPEPAPAERTIDPDIPEGGVIADDDAMGHTACELWMYTLDNEADLRDVVDDVDWYSQQADNDHMSSHLNRGWAADRPDHVRIFCSWNGYEVEDGSPADLLG